MVGGYINPPYDKVSAVRDLGNVMHSEREFEVTLAPAQIVGLLGR